MYTLGARICLGTPLTLRCRHKCLSCLYWLSQRHSFLVHIHERCQPNIFLYYLSFFICRSARILLFRIDFRLAES